MNCVKRGAFIVIEGVDRSGKSTQCEKLVDRLNALNVKSKLINFPDRSTSIGKIIDKYLKAETNLNDETIHLMFAANRWERKNDMESWLKNGYTLIVDRYSFSGIVYSSIKKNMNLKWCQSPENGLLKPDQVFLLMLNDEIISQRPNYGQERYENKETQEKVSEAYLNLKAEQNNWEIIEASGSIETVHEMLLRKTLKIIDEIDGKPIQTLYFHSESRNTLV